MMTMANAICRHMCVFEWKKEKNGVVEIWGFKYFEMLVVNCVMQNSLSDGEE